MKMKNLHIFSFRLKQLIRVVNVSKLPVNGFKWLEDTSEINEEFIKNYDKINNKGYILEVDVKYPRKLHDVVHIKSLKQALNHR